MATSIGLTSDNVGLDPGGESDSSDSEGDLVHLSSWSYIFRSMKELLKAGEIIDLATIYKSANHACIYGDPVSALDFFSLALTRSLEEHYYLAQRSAQSRDTVPNTSNVPLNRRFLCQAMSLCKHLQFDELSEPFKRKLKLALDNITQKCDVLSLMNVHVLCGAAALYFRMGQHHKALELSGRAVQMSHHSLSSQEAFENICCNILERWHFHMLNDKGRNYAYQQAIENIVMKTKRGVSICDVGCGSGLLSLMAAKQDNCSQVYAVEKSDIMCDVATDVLRANLTSDTAAKVRVINKMSSGMSVPTDIPHKVDILVTETFDAGLFGEGILPTLCHAWSVLLKNNDLEKGHVIPSKAELYIQAIESDYILREHRFTGTFRDLDISSLHIYSAVGFCDSEPYTTHDLKYLPGGLKTLSEPIKCMDVDFNDPMGLSSLNKGKSQKVSLNMNKSGRLDAIVLWFSLYLDESVVLSTHTDCYRCWDQAVFPVCPLRVAEQPLSRGSEVSMKVHADDTVNIAQRVEGGRLCMAVTAISNASESPVHFGQFLPAVDGDIVAKLVNDPMEWCNYDVYCLGELEILALNNMIWQTVLHNRLQELLAQAKKKNGNTQTHFIHMNDGFSPMCLQALQLGYQHSITSAYIPPHKTLLCKIAAKNNIDLRRVTIYEEERMYASLVMQDAVEVHESGQPMTTAVSAHPHLHQESSVPLPGQSGASGEAEVSLSCEEGSQNAAGLDRKQENDAMITSGLLSGTLPHIEMSAVALCDIVDGHGRLSESLFNILQVTRYDLARYASKAVIPHSLDMYGVLVDSQHLLRLSCVVNDDNTLGFTIGDFINKFAIRNYQAITLNSLPHTKLCQPFKMFSIDISELVEAPGFMCTACGDVLHPAGDCRTQSKNVTSLASDEATGHGNAGSQDEIMKPKQMKEMVTMVQTTDPEDRRKAAPFLTHGQSSESMQFQPESSHTDTALLPDEKLVMKTDQGVNSSEPSEHLFTLDQNCSNIPPKEDVSSHETPAMSHDSLLLKSPAHQTPIKHSSEASSTSATTGDEIQDFTSQPYAPDSITCSATTTESYSSSLLDSGQDYAEGSSKIVSHSSSDQDISAESAGKLKRKRSPGIPGVLNDGSDETKMAKCQRNSAKDKDSSEADVNEDLDDDTNSGGFKQTKNLKVRIIHPGNVTALIYWFDLHLSPTCSINTLDPDHHWKQAAVMTHPYQRQSVAPGDELNLCCQVYNAAVSFLITGES